MDSLTACLFGKDRRNGREEEDDTVLLAPVAKATLEQQKSCRSEGSRVEILVACQCLNDDQDPYTPSFIHIK
jgi:hypothetical protein